MKFKQLLSIQLNSNSVLTYTSTLSGAGRLEINDKQLFQFRNTYKKAYDFFSVVKSRAIVFIFLLFGILICIGGAELSSIISNISNG